MNKPRKTMPQHQQTNIVQVSKTEMRVGLLPPPEELEAYDRLNPGFSERMMVMAEKEQGHRHQTNNRQLTLNEHAVKQDIKQRWSIIFFTFLFVVIFLALLLFMVYKGYAMYSIIGLVTSIPGVLGLLYLRNSNKGKTQSE